MENSIILIIGGSICVMIYILYVIASVIAHKRCVNRYISNFREEYEKDTAIKSVLNGLLKRYKKRTKEHEAIESALYHLDHSVMKDYKTALGFISAVLKDKRIYRLHQRYVEHMRQEKSRLLELKEGN